jgi:hypothetical protein
VKIRNALNAYKVKVHKPEENRLFYGPKRRQDNIKKDLAGWLRPRTGGELL